MTGPEQKKTNDPQGSSKSSEAPSSPQAGHVEHKDKQPHEHPARIHPNHIHPSYKPLGKEHHARCGLDLTAQPKPVRKKRKG